MEVLTMTLLDSLEEDEVPTKDEVREIRKKLELNTTQAGKIVGVSKRTWERYESGKQVLSRGSWIYLKLIANELPRVKVLVIGSK